MRNTPTAIAASVALSIQSCGVVPFRTISVQYPAQSSTVNIHRIQNTHTRHIHIHIGDVNPINALRHIQPRTQPLQPNWLHKWRGLAARACVYTMYFWGTDVCIVCIVCIVRVYGTVDTQGCSHFEKGGAMLLSQIDEHGKHSEGYRAYIINPYNTWAGTAHPQVTIENKGSGCCAIVTWGCAVPARALYGLNIDQVSLAMRRERWLRNGVARLASTAKPAPLASSATLLGLVRVGTAAGVLVRVTVVVAMDGWAATLGVGAATCMLLPAT